jgi:hypothetical protein
MTLPKNTLKYDDYSLHDLRKFATDRKLPCKNAPTKVYTKKTNRKKSQGTKEKVERRKLLDTLRRSDATATFQFFDLPLELREYVYGFAIINLMGRKGVERGDSGKIRERLKPVSERVCEEACAEFEREMDVRDAREAARSGQFREEYCPGLPGRVFDVRDPLPRQFSSGEMASGKSFLDPSLLDLVRRPGSHLSIVGAAGTGKSQTNRVVMPGRDKYVMKLQLHEERRVLC